MTPSTNVNDAVQRVVAQLQAGAAYVTPVRRAEKRQTAEEIFRERVTRRADVPIHEVEIENRGRRYLALVAPVCPGAEPGTLRIRACVRPSYESNGWVRDMGRHTVPMAIPSSIEPGSIDDAWSKLSAHQRLSMFAAVAHRTPKGGPRQEGSPTSGSEGSFAAPS